MKNPYAFPKSYAPLTFEQRCGISINNSDLHDGGNDARLLVSILGTFNYKSSSGGAFRNANHSGSCSRPGIATNQNGNGIRSCLFSIPNSLCRS